MSISEEKLSRISNEVRQDIITMLFEARSGHTAGSLGMVDVFSVLYFNTLHIDPKRPKWSKRDRLILSCGHIAPVLYAVLARAGFFPLVELKTLRQIDSRLQGHPSYNSLPGIETTSGPLGQGLSQSIGMALGAKLNQERYSIFCVMSDGEQQEGQTWEAVMFAGAKKLDNLVAIIDRNQIQISGSTEEIMPIEPLREKYEAFNWHVSEIDGHNFSDISDALDEAKSIKNKPALVIANTVPGKGVSFIENNYLWHGKSPTPEEGAMALRELRSLDKIK